MILNRARFVLMAASALCLAGTVLAQPKGEPPQLTPEQQAEMEAWQKAGTPGPQHAALAKAAGTYSMKIKSWPAPGAPAMDDSGTATRTMMLDGRILTEDVKSTMMGAPMTGHGMRGFDNVTGKYWSTWIDSMSTGMMISEGKCDANDNCTFIGTYNDAVKKAPVKSRMTSKWTSPTSQLFELYGPAKDGKEFKMMEIVYTKN